MSDDFEIGDASHGGDAVVSVIELGARPDDEQRHVILDHKLYAVTHETPRYGRARRQR